MLLSPSWRFLMNPDGLPFLAGRTVTFRSSPGFMDVLLTPCRVSTWVEAVVRIHVVIFLLPSFAGTSSSMRAWGFVKFNFLSRPSRVTSLFRSYTPATAWWARTATPVVRKAHRTISPANRGLIDAPSRRLVRG